MAGRFEHVCGFCYEEHRGACAHPDCPIAYTGGLGEVGAQRRLAPVPTRPSVAGEAPTRASTPRPEAPRRPQRAPNIATRPSVTADPPPPAPGGEP